MASRTTPGNEVSVGSATNEYDDDTFEVVDERPEMRASVEQEIQARVDTTHPETRPEGLTLEAEERMAAREWEIERTARRFDRHQHGEREARTRAMATDGSRRRREGFQRRAASVDTWADPDGVDPRAQLDRETLGIVNSEAARLDETLPRWSRAAISRRLAERLVEGADALGAVVGVFEELQQAPGQVIPIGAVEKTSRCEVDIAGRVTTLWTPKSPKIQQVGLIEDASGCTKFTAWKRSDVPCVQEGERVVLRNVSKSWHEGRVSVALTGWSSIEFPERERWWAE